MPSRYDVYGFAELGLAEARSLVESLLGITLTERDSSYWGLYYRAGKGAARDLMLYANEQGQWHTAEHARYRVILLVNDLADMDEIQRRLTAGRTEPVLLQSRVLPDEPPDEDDGSAEAADRAT